MTISAVESVEASKNASLLPFSRDAIDIVLVVQSLIVLFIAAPPLIRALFRLPVPAGEPKPVSLRRPRVKAVTR